MKYMILDDLWTDLWLVEKNPCLRELAMSVDKSAEGGRSIMTALSYTSH